MSAAKRQEEVVRVSVRSLVEFILRSGDIDSRRGAGREREAMQAGSRLHRKIEREWGVGYQAEVPLKWQTNLEEVTLVVEGRADGIAEDGENVTILEIKSMYLDVTRLSEPVAVHRAQASCYAAIVAEQKGLSHIGIRMIYAGLEDGALQSFDEEWDAGDLSAWFQNLVGEYGKWALWQYRHRLKRDASLSNLPFPFPYREGQRDLAVSVYRTITRGRTLFIQAPTGVGKTMSCVYPALKSMGEGYGDKLFYLTAKSVTRTVAEEALEILRSEGLTFFSVTVTAKEKLCVLPRPECNPDACPYAAGHFDRINDVVFSLIQEETRITREKLLQTAQENRVCPFELCLDLTTWADGVICDYNYVFDPNVYLKRFFGEGVCGDYLFLWDEAHNLAERAREMYSAVLFKEDFLAARRLVKGKSKKLETKITRCNKILLDLKRECETYKVLPEIDFFVMALEALFSEMQDFAEENRSLDTNETYRDFFFAVRHFLNIHEMMDENFRVYAEIQPDGRFLLKELCVNPAGPLSHCLKKGNSTIFYSATLLPMPYRELLRGDEEDYAVYAPSPFDRKNRLLAVAEDVSSLYRKRGPAQYAKIYDYIRMTVKAHAGNYLVFFPSYAFLESVLAAGEEEDEEETPALPAAGNAPEEWIIPEEYEEAKEADGPADAEKEDAGENGASPEKRDETLTVIRRPGCRSLKQASRMSEAEREAFLAAFSGESAESLVGFCVMGGIFAEGIDLVGDRLIGALVVGTGIPQVCTEREILRDFYHEAGKNGFDFAYRYPGMNKVLQAAGRVIRTSSDRGVIVLLDDRFLNPESVALFPREWDDYQVTDREHFPALLESFWTGDPSGKDG